MRPAPLGVFKCTLKSLGYRVSHFHREPQSIKTNAPNEVVYDLLRLWAREHPPAKLALPQLLEKPVGIEHPVRWAKEEKTSPQRRRAPRFVPNEQQGWGPKAPAKGASGLLRQALHRSASRDRSARPAATCIQRRHRPVVCKLMLMSVFLQCGMGRRWHAAGCSGDNCKSKLGACRSRVPKALHNARFTLGSSVAFGRSLLSR
eukprot:TRINITY_DN45547_c2_g2_i2.p1 TRINITY_DN45547_c2_g2~~TRINITY_DN45547_c2_g2_i2.p1  ORF type:complete len:203 (-),score=20.78 TRINITY_DN45547_c2_g2_i2:1023-1631(-)